MRKPKVIVLRTAGTNCDRETAFAFGAAGAETELVHINELTGRRKKLNDYSILALPGGFTYGDDVASGKILANELKFKLEEDLQKFIGDGKLIIGICNGFQILVKAGLLPNLAGDFQTIEATLTLNDSNKFEDRWVYLKNPNDKIQMTKCVWTKGINEVIRLPVAHGEGKFIPRDDRILKTLKRDGMIALEYTDEKGRKKGYPYNPNGSIEGIAGVCDRTGRIFGLMPHPERHILFHQGPEWTRTTRKNTKEGDGFTIFTNGVKFVRKHL
ncbi:MAG: phosphoribosylformylglycinamidine synthase I [Candidatus Omnitrophica bacterium]|nr:phosphoribosylformylglycinamidine synthase I [Candidatus Omnitrophota bacterium]MDD5436871.1 phosphoribosylformylglycinamidine synthase I [Candidatus Omnitrophota bacterium]